MSINKILKITIMILFAFVFTDIALSCPDNTAPTIISPEDNDVVRAGSTVLCHATGDAVITWSGPGFFTPTTGSSVYWTAPVALGYVTITATNSYGSDQVTVKTADIIYVDKDAAPDGDGTSWDDAYKYLQDALDEASSGNHIWVAEGTYYPDEGDTPTDDDDTETFQLEDGVEVYGGFDATETFRSQRDWVNHVTILSGDIDGDETLNNTNSNHVVTCQYADSSTVLDGFTITMGWANSGLCDGAGMKITSASPTVSNCTFRDNRAYGRDGDGGGMSCLYSSPTVTNCIFIDNVAGDDGGALVNSKGSNGTFTNCVFYSNNTNGENLEYVDGEYQGKSNGGAIWNTCGETYNVEGSSPKFINCLIAENSTVPGSNNGGKNGGGAGNKGADTDPVYINCTFTANTANWDGGGMVTKDNAEATVINCIFWDNSAGTGYSNNAICDKDGGVTTVSYSDLDQDGYDAPDDNNINQDPNFANPDDPDGPDDRFLTCDDGFRIRFDSNCVDAADCTATDAPATDILDFNRVDIRAVTNTGEGPRYSDMGAYEAVVEHVIFISVDGLSATYLEPMVTAGDVPKIKRIKDEGLWTYDARPDYRWTKTLPNHVTMVTGRPVEKGGLTSTTTHHGYTSNDYPSGSDTLHNTGNTGDPPTGYMYKASPFDIVHDRGMKTALYGGKSKFVIFWQSYNETGGRPDQVTPPDDGEKKIDTYACWGDYDDVHSVTLVNTFMANGCNDNFNFTFLHFKGPDREGHDHNWNSDQWKYAVVQVNNRIESILGMVENSSNEEWYYNTVIVMTADHGGINGGHGDPTIQEEFELPFGVWGHLVPKGNAYTYSGGTRSDPVNARGNDYDIPYNDTEQPIRHADGVDLGLSFLGLPEIDGALIKGMQIKLP